jgi:hypothetical protein
VFLEATCTLREDMLLATRSRIVARIGTATFFLRSRVRFSRSAARCHRTCTIRSALMSAEDAPISIRTGSRSTTHLCSVSLQ